MEELQHISNESVPPPYSEPTTFRTQTPIHSSETSMFRIPISELKDMAYHIRRDLIELVYKTKSGHLDTSLSLVEVWLGLVYSEFFRFDPKNGAWEGRDRIFLSEGHACPIQYMVNAYLGYYDKSELFAGNRKPKTAFQGHSVRNLAYGFENSNGSLGIGVWQAYGHALETDRNVFCIAGDGEFQEPSAIGLLAAPHNVKPAPNFALILNNNGLAQDAPVDIGPLGEVAAAYGWFVDKVDGHDFEAVGRAFQRAVNIPNRPKFLIFHTVKGQGGDPAKAGKLGSHGKPPANESEYQAYIQGLEESRR